MYAAHPPGPAQSRSKEVSTSTELLIASPARTVQACREESANRPRPVHNSSLLQFFTSGSGAGNPVGVSPGSKACLRRLRSTYLTDCTVEGEDPVYTVQTARCYVLYTAHGTWQRHVSRQSIILYREQRSDQTVAQNSKCFPAHEKPWHVAQIGA
jgi:hypothetical protein